MNVSDYPNRSISTARKLQTATGPRFGCRLFAYVSPQPYLGQDEFLRQCLLTGGNSMKRQNQLPVGEQGDIEQEAIPDFDGKSKEGGVRKAGWGLAYAPHHSPRENEPGLTVNKSYRPTWQDSQFDTVAKHAASSQPKVLLTHLRETFDGVRQGLRQENAHPFRQGDWVLMQHGDFPQTTREGLEERLKAWHSRDADIPLPLGEVDSERIACYVAAKFKQKYGSTNIAPLTRQQVTDVFQKAVREVIRWPETGDSKKPVGHYSYPGTYNLVLSDGERVFATHYGASSKMYQGTRVKSDGSEEILLVTDKMQPTAKSGQQKIDWQPVPDNCLLVLERARDANGKVKVKAHAMPLLSEGAEAFYEDARMKSAKGPMQKLWAKMIGLFSRTKRFVKKLGEKLRQWGNGIRQTVYRAYQRFKSLFQRKNAG